MKKVRNNADTQIKKLKEVLENVLKVGEFSEESMKQMIGSLKEFRDRNDGLSEIIDILAYERENEKICKPSSKSESFEVKKLHFLIKNLKLTVSRLELENKQLSEMVKNITHEKALSKDLNVILSDFRNSCSPVPRDRPKLFCTTPKVIKPVRATLDNVLDGLYKASSYEEVTYKQGLNELYDIGKKFSGADGLFFFQTNFSKTLLIADTKQGRIEIPFKNSMFTVVITANSSIISKEGEPNFDTRLSQYLGIPIRSFCAVPVSCDKSNHGVLLGVSKRFEHPSGLESLSKALSLLLTKWKNHKAHQQERETFKFVLISCENLVSKTNTYEFARTLESYLCKIVNCKRANVIMIDPIVKKFVKRLGDPPYQSLVMYSLQKGLAGAAATARESIICNDVAFDRRFYQEIDDPLGICTTSILSVPLIARNQTAETFPIAVIQFIDHNDYEGFTEKDAKLGKKYCFTIARIHEAIKMLENVNSIHEMSKRIDGTLEELMDTMEDRSIENKGLKRNLTLFRNAIVPFMRKIRR